jgi:hypothetical protein
MGPGVDIHCRPWKKYTHAEQKGAPR